MAETAPQYDDVRIGIEIEGIGSLSMKWGAAAPSFANADDKARFKRTPLVRSKSFNASRGVALNPEETGASNMGKQHPAELVSSPHKLDATNLANLRSSVRKALFKNIIEWKRGADKATTFSDVAVTTNWTRHNISKISGSLQTTIGVSTAKLLSDSEDDRDAVVGLLIAGDFKTYASALLSAAVKGQKYLSGKVPALSASADSQKQYGLRLVLFMYLIHLCVKKILGAQGRSTAWEKTALGASFKGFTSFVGCGVYDDNTPLSGQGDDVKTGLIEAMGDGGAKWLTDSLAELVLADVGKPDLSMQVQYEKSTAIKCFTNNGKLYTVIESRQKESLLNQMMATFLNSETAPAAGLFGAIRGVVGV